MKPDSEKIKSFIDNLANESWLGPVRSHWVKYIFHHTDIRNAVAILKSGKLLCRRRLDETGGMVVDNASRPIISSTESLVKDYVRLYFRPRNPTQYRNEGVRPKDKQWEESHCPVPVFFLFDSKSILTRDECFFSEGNLASLGVQGLRSTAKDLSNFDFKKIYHDSPHNDSSITFHKNAEVVIPNELDLSVLKYIVCRSPAERESLLNLLPEDVFARWSSKILVDTKANFYFRKWVYVQTVDLTSKYVAIDFSPDAIHPSPFALTARLKANREKIFQRQNFRANEKIVFEFVEDVYIYQIEVKLDDELVYVGKFDGSNDMPF
jgi:hypothetical protein